MNFETRIKKLSGFTNTEKQFIADGVAEYMQRAERLRDPEKALTSARAMLANLDKEGDTFRRKALEHEDPLKKKILELVVEALQEVVGEENNHHSERSKSDDQEPSSKGLFAKRSQPEGSGPRKQRVKEVAPENAFSLSRIDQEGYRHVSSYFRPILRAPRPVEEDCGQWLDRTVRVGSLEVPVKVGYFSAGYETRSQATWYVEAASFLAALDTMKRTATEEQQAASHTPVDVNACKEDIQNILAAVAKKEGVADWAITDGTLNKRPNVSHARKLFAYALRIGLGLSDTQIGNAMGRSAGYVGASIRETAKSHEAVKAVEDLLTALQITPPANRQMGASGRER